MKIKAVYDSGSNVSLINEKIVDSLKSDTVKQKHVFKIFSGFNFSSGQANVLLKIGNRTSFLNTYVVNSSQLSYDLLIGLDAIRKFKLIQDDNLDILQRINEKIIKLEDIEKTLENKQDAQFEECVEVNFHKCFDEDEIFINLDHIEEGEKKSQIVELINQYKHIFARGKFDVGHVKSREAEIKLTKEEYVTSRPYNCSIPDQIEIKNQVNKLLDADLVEESDSPYASPVTLAYKKEDGRRSRLCIDFRKLNKLVVHFQP